MSYYYKQFFSIESVMQLQTDGYAVEGTSGGLVLGPTHDAGGIYMLQFIGSGYSLVGEIEGYEYFLNPAASAYFFKSFKHLNNFNADKTHNFIEYDIPEDISVIDARLKDRSRYNSKFLLFDHRFSFAICNRYSTTKQLQVLNNLNNSLYHEYDSADYSLTKRMNILLRATKEKVWSIRYATKDDDPSTFLSGSVIKD